MRAPLALLVCFFPSVLGAEGADWERFFEDAWARGTRGREIAWAQVGAWARLRADQAQWFPVLSFGSDASRPQQLSVRALEEAETLSLSLSGSLTQRLPGGGSVKITAQVEPLWPKVIPDSEPEWAPDFSFEGALPLGRASPEVLARLRYEAEMLEQWSATTLGWLELVEAASELDLARLTVVARRAREAIAVQKAEATDILRSQGRASESLLASDQGQVLRVRWDRIQSESALRLAEGTWKRLCGLELPTIDEESLLVWARSRRRTRVEEIDVERQRVQSRLTDLQVRDQTVGLAPVLGWGLSVSRPGGHSAAVAVQLGLSVTTDFAVVGPPLELVRTAGLARGDLLVEGAKRSLAQQTDLREPSLLALRGARESIVGHLVTAQRLRDSLSGLAQRREVPVAEALEAEAVVAELVLLGRRLAWEEVLEVGFR